MRIGGCRYGGGVKVVGLMVSTGTAIIVGDGWNVNKYRGCEWMWGLKDIVVTQIVETSVHVAGVRVHGVVTVTMKS